MIWWLWLFFSVSMVPLGSLTVLLVHGVTGGRWGRDLAPALIPAARTIPLLIVAVLPIMLFRPALYHWDALTVPADVRRLYLNPIFFDVRTVAAFAIWSALAWARAWERPVLAAAGLVLHLVLTSVIPTDWVLTLAPGAVSAGFGFGVGVEQVFAALAFAAVWAPQDRSDPRASRDLSGMLVAALLGTVYFFYMQFAITWYGNIPDKVHWYAFRAEAGWTLVALAAFLLGAALPFLSILSPVVRRTPSALRVVGAFVLLGTLLHAAYLILPATGAPHGG
jgi:hypothetical protein